MRAFVIRSWASGFMLLIAAIAAGDEPNEQPSLVSGSLEDFAHRVFRITDVVLDHHIEPPTRQEMLLCGLTALLGDAAPEDLSRAVSGVAKENDFVECLVRFWPEADRRLLNLPVPPNLTRDEALRWRFLGGMSSAVPGELDIIPAKEAVVQRQLAANQYVGIGVALAKPEDAKVYQFGEVFPRGPAGKARIEPGELLLEVDGASTEKLSMTELIDHLRGPEGTTVSMKVARDAKSEPRVLTLTRSVVPRQTVIGNRKLGPEQWESIVPGDRPVGYLRIDEIGGSTVAELREYEAELTAKQVNELVLDLRFADSRELRYAIALADALIDGGNAGSVFWRDGSHPLQLDRDCLFREWRMAVLVGEYTSGYAEWIAAALQKMRGAIVVGMPTAGETRFVLKAVELPEGLGAMRLAVAVLERTQQPSFATGATLSRHAESLLFRLPQRNFSRWEAALVPNIGVPLAPGEREGTPDRQARLVTRAIEVFKDPPTTNPEGVRDEADPTP